MNIIYYLKEQINELSKKLNESNFESGMLWMNSNSRCIENAIKFLQLLLIMVVEKVNFNLDQFT